MIYFCHFFHNTTFGAHLRRIFSIITHITINIIQYKSTPHHLFHSEVFTRFLTIELHRNQKRIFEILQE